MNNPFQPPKCSPQGVWPLVWSGDWVDAGGERFHLWLGMIGKYVSLLMNDLSMSPNYTIEGQSFSFKEELLYGGTITLTLQDDGSFRMTGAAGTRTLVKKHGEE